CRIARMTRRLLVSVAAAALGLIGAAPASASHPYHVNFKNFPLDAADSTRDGTVLSGTSLQLASSGLGSFDYTDPFAYYAGDTANGSGPYEYGTWTSGLTTLSFPWNELVSSWNAETPAGTWIQVEMQPTLGNGHEAKWYILGRWVYGDSDFHRTSVGGQGDADGYVAIDTYFAKDHPAISYRLRVKLCRAAGTTATPRFTRLSAIASNYTNPKGSFPSDSTMNGTPLDLGVPEYSQEVHHHEFEQFDGGGEAWCSPTSTSMVVAYWDAMFPGNGYAPS